MEQMSLKDVAALLQLKAYKVEYVLAHGLVPEPKLRISGRRVFGPEDLANLKAHFGTKQHGAEAPVEPAAVGV